MLGLILQTHEHMLHFIDINRAAAGAKLTVTAILQLCTGQSKMKEYPLRVVTLPLTRMVGTACF